MNIEKMQAYLNEHEIDGWLLADFHGRNDIAVELLRLEGIVTRRSFYFIPAQGEPIGIVHAIEKAKFQGLPGRLITYSSYKLLESELEKVLAGAKKIAMEYSPKGRLPYIGLVDAGTVELVRGLDKEIVSSADLVANFQARLSAEQMATHRIAANNVIEIKDKAMEFIRKSLQDGKSITEYDVAQYIIEQFTEYDMETDSSPICGVDGNAGNPHYEPTRESAAEIKMGHLILIDLWGKLKHRDGVYGDITWMCYAGPKEEISNKYRDLFAIIVKARDEAVKYVQTHIDSQPVFGSQVDDACRKVVADAGFGENFTHRTGHSITNLTHGTGPNIDNLETEDRRKLQRGHLFSIEPGIYMHDCGFRTEINVLIDHNGAEITTLPLQTEIVPLF